MSNLHESFLSVEQTLVIEEQSDVIAVHGRSLSEIPPSYEESFVVLTLLVVAVVLHEHYYKSVESDLVMGEKIMGVESRMVRKLEKHCVQTMMVQVELRTGKHHSVDAQNEGELQEIVKSEGSVMRHQRLHFLLSGMQHQRVIRQSDIFGHFPVLMQVL